MNGTNKLYRTLSIFFRGMRGEDLAVKPLSDEYGVSTKTIARDISDLKAFFSESRDLLGYADMVYSHQSKAYRIYFDDFLTDAELMAVVKILIASRSLNRRDMINLVGKIKNLSASKDRKMINDFVRNELYYYTAVGSDVSHVSDRVWQISRVIAQKKEITVTYYKMDRTEITRRIKPASIMFSEYYFYLIAFHQTDNGYEERFYRIDRIKDVTEHRNTIMPDLKYSEGELRRTNQFMFPGVKRRIVFEFSGPSVQAVLDRLPTAKIIDVRNGKTIIEAEVYGDGIKMWLLSQGAWARVLEPKELADEIRREATEILRRYESNQ